MAGENSNTGQSAEEKSVSLAEYQKLQRKLDKTTKRASKLEEQVESTLSSLARQEHLIEQMLKVVGTDDQEAQKLLDENDQRRRADMTSAQLTARLNTMLDSADADWEDEKFDSARRLLDQINDSGDLSKAPELERLVQEAVKPSEEDFEARVAAAVEERVQSGGQDRSSQRVDTGETTASGGGAVTRGDLKFDPKRDGIEGLRERANKALEQLTS